MYGNEGDFEKADDNLKRNRMNKWIKILFEQQLNNIFQDNILEWTLIDLILILYIDRKISINNWTFGYSLFDYSDFRSLWTVYVMWTNQNKNETYFQNIVKYCLTMLSMYVNVKSKTRNNWIFLFYLPGNI